SRPRRGSSSIATFAIASRSSTTICDRAMIYDLAFPRFRPPREGARIDGVTISWLGTAAHVVSTKTTTVLIDPYVSRHRLAQVAGRRLEPDDAAIARWIPT